MQINGERQYDSYHVHFGILTATRDLVTFAAGIDARARQRVWQLVDRPLTDAPKASITSTAPKRRLVHFWLALMRSSLFRQLASPLLSLAGGPCVCSATQWPRYHDASDNIVSALASAPSVSLSLRFKCVSRLRCVRTVVLRAKKYFILLFFSYISTISAFSISYSEKKKKKIVRK